jgi:hypothetical protein
MRYASTDKVFYCGDCGHISDTCAYVSSVSEWGTVFQGRYGLDHEARDSETNETWYKCEECDEEFGRGDGEMTYAQALENKMGNFDLTDDEQEDYNDIFGEPEPPEPREGRNTLKCPEEVSNGA